MEEQKLLTHWKQSLKPFKKGNLKLYLLGSLATWLRTVKAITRSFWWLLLAKWAANIIAFQTKATDNASFIMLILADILFFYIAVMTVRPSIEIKNYRYYWQYSISIVLLLLLSPLNNVSFFVLIAFMLLFFLDSGLSLLGFIKSVEQTLKTLIFFAPACMIFTVLAIATYALTLPLLLLAINTHWLQHQVIFWIPYLIIRDLFFLLVLSAIAVYYIKIKHEHFDFLFE